MRPQYAYGAYTAVLDPLADSHRRRKKYKKKKKNMKNGNERKAYDLYCVWHLCCSGFPRPE